MPARLSTATHAATHARMPSLAHAPWQSGITWWAHYNFHLSRQQSGPLKDCWMVEQMFGAPPPVDVDSRDGTPQIAQEA